MRKVRATRYDAFKDKRMVSLYAREWAAYGWIMIVVIAVAIVNAV